MSVRERMMGAICYYVDAYREAYGEKPTPGKKKELSCFAHGEAFNLLYVQLVNTTEGTGAWDELDYQPVLEMTYKYIVNELKDTKISKEDQDQLVGLIETIERAK